MDRGTVDQGPGIFYSAVDVGRSLWGLPIDCSDSPISIPDGEIVIYYGGWSLKQLRKSSAGLTLMAQDREWYDDKEWAAARGYYRVLLPLPGSNKRGWYEMTEYLQATHKGWDPAPVVIAATAILVHMTQTGGNLLQAGWCYCAELLPHTNVVGLAVIGGRLNVGRYSEDRSHERLWLAASRKC